jgi:hypothetical protein
VSIFIDITVSGGINGAYFKEIGISLIAITLPFDFDGFCRDIWLGSTNSLRVIVVFVDSDGSFCGC